MPVRKFPREPEYYGVSDLDLLSLPWTGILSILIALVVVCLWAIWVWKIFRKETVR